MPLQNPSFLSTDRRRGARGTASAVRIGRQRPGRVAAAPEPREVRVVHADPDALEAASRRLGAAAAQVHRCAGRLSDAGRSMRWEGQAAVAFRAALAADAARLRTVAGELEDAALAMRRHAATVRERLAQLRALDSAAEAAVGAALSAAAEAAGSVRRLP